MCIRDRGTPVLDQYGRDLTRAARDGELDPVVGREAEIQRVIQILCRRTKNNPTLIGDPGVGKSTVIEGLAQRIASGKIPELLKDKRIVTLDLGSMLAGTKYRGEFEERITNAISELREDGSTCLLYTSYDRNRARKDGDPCGGSKLTVYPLFTLCRCVW